MDPRYIRNDWLSLLAHLSEECTEVSTAVSKCMRWGLGSVWRGESNEARVLRELDDLEAVIVRFRAKMQSTTPELRSAEPRSRLGGHPGISARRCTYPECDCAVSFPEGYTPSEATQCPRCA